MIGTPLRNAVSDPKRRFAEGRIREIKDRTLYVEGNADEFFFSNYIKSYPMIKVKRVFSDYGNKDKVIEEVKECIDRHGIVDMDYDFNSKKIKDVKNICDTNPKCNLFSFALDNNYDRKYDKIGINILNSYDIRYSFEDMYSMVAKNNSISWLMQNGSMFNDYVKERTDAILFRGWVNNEYFPKPGDNFTNINSIISKNKRVWVNDLIPDDKVNDFTKFKSLHEVYLKKCGVNDHQLISGLIIILKNCNYPSRKEKRLKKELERAIWGLMISESKPEEIVKLLDKVGIKKNH
tara:strand:+ start:54 stop:929 length:876 start_codon:yes stop_codon:yes gene_type:complete